MWDFITSFTCSTGRQHGVVYDGEYIYTSAWGKSSTVLSMFYKYDLEGNLIEEMHDLLLANGIQNEYYCSPGTAHEWLSWRRSLYQFAKKLFK